MLVIYRSVNRSMETFALSPQSRAALEAEWGPVHRWALAGRVSLGLSSEQLANMRPGTVRASVVPSVVALLTGREEHRLAHFGPVVVMDPVAEQELVQE